MSDSRESGGDVLERLLRESKREPILLAEEKAVCPACGEPTLTIREYLYEVPYFGKIVLGEGRCSNCGYKYSDVRVAEVSEPKKIVVRVNGEKELRYLLVKSATAAILIRERGFEMIPGPASIGFISTVEGILHRFLEAVSVICGSEPESSACKENKAWLEKAIEGEEKFTLVICDYEGASKAVGEDVIEASIDEECLKLYEKSTEWVRRRF